MTDHTREKLIARIAALPPGSTVGAEHVPYTLSREEWLELLEAASPDSQPSSAHSPRCLVRLFRVLLAISLLGSSSWLATAPAEQPTPDYAAILNATRVREVAPEPRQTIPGVMPAFRPSIFDPFNVRQPLAPKAAADDAPKYGKGLVVPKDLGNRIRLSFKRNGPQFALMAPATEPEYDLRTLGLVTAIVDQGQCGSCWDFSGIATAESAYIKAGKGRAEQVAWSQQSILDCGRNGGCNGDWPETCLEQVKNAGVADAKDYPYTARESSCKNVPHGNTIDDYGYVGSDSSVPKVQAIKDAMKAKGVISVAVAADNAFANYKGGVFKDSGSRQIDHAVNLVGWKDDASVPGGGYWIMRNSWGTGWGEKGYMRIAYNANLIGYGAMWASVNPVAPPTPPVPPVPPTPPTPPTPGAFGPVTVDQASGTITFSGPWKVKGGVIPSLADELSAAGVSDTMVNLILSLVAEAKKQPAKAEPPVLKP